MRILVTGGSGFIGTNLVESFSAAGHEVYSTDRVPPKDPKHIRFYTEMDLLNVDEMIRTVTKLAPTHVVHMGARTDLVDDSDGSVYAANTVGTRNLVAAMRAAGSVIRCIFASTKLVYRNGAIPRGPEDFDPDTDYGASKAEMERMLRGTSMPWVWCIVRPTSIWGPWFHVPYRGFVLAVAKGRYFHLGNVDPPRSFGYVGNLVHQINSLLNAPAVVIQGRVFYLTDYKQYRIAEWATVIARQLGRRQPRTMPEGLVQMLACIGDWFWALGWKGVPMTSFRLRNMRTDTSNVPIGELESITGQVPFSLESGVQETINWLRSQRLL